MPIQPDQPLFYLDPLPEAGHEGELTPDESRHVLASRRKTVNDKLYLMDGRGGLARATITDVRRKRLVVAKVEEKSCQDRPETIFYVASALPKGDRAVTMLEMLTQLGMTRFIPLQCEYSQTKISARTIARLERVCLAACKQSRRLWRPEISQPMALHAMLEKSENVRLLVAHPEISSGSGKISKKSEEIMAMIGPEGGFSPAEIERIRCSGAEWISLGKNVLRVEAAAVAIMTLMSLCGDQ